MPPAIALWLLLMQSGLNSLARFVETFLNLGEFSPTALLRLWVDHLAVQHSGVAQYGAGLGEARAVELLSF
jgi:hypothetical protein